MSTCQRFPIYFFIKPMGNNERRFKTSCLAKGAPGSALQGLCHCFSRVFHLSLCLWSPWSLSNMLIRIRRGRPEAFLGSIEALVKCFGPCRIEAPEKKTHKRNSKKSMSNFGTQQKSFSSLRGRSSCALALLVAACLQGTEAGAHNPTC